MSRDPFDSFEKIIIRRGQRAIFVAAIIQFIVGLCLVAATVYVAAHFLAKVW